MWGLKWIIQKPKLYGYVVEKYADDKICSEINFQWTTNIKLLGVHYDVDFTKITEKA